MSGAGIRNRCICTCAAVICGLLAGCGETEIRTRPVAILGSINAPAGAESDGKVYINLYHAWALDGELRHPVEFIDSFEADVGPFSIEVDYPIDNGEGLLVYAWLDNDGDGVLCTPTDRNDLTGLTEVESFPAERVTVQIDLVAPCAGPDWFYPPAT